MDNPACLFTGENVSRYLDLETSYPFTPSESNLKEQFHQACSDRSPEKLSLTSSTSQYHEPMNGNALLEPFIDVDAYLDMTICCLPTTLQASTCFNESPQPDSVPVTVTQQVPDRILAATCSEIVYDRFLSPWPGSLAAAYQHMTTA
jgi:hypothetical protein